jgi:hypothetical protein
VHARNASNTPSVYPAANRSPWIRFDLAGGGEIVQKAQPRDIGALALVVAVFLVLFILSVMLGSPTG